MHIFIATLRTSSFLFYDFFFNAGLYINRQVPNMHVVFSIRFAVPLPAFKAVVGSFNKLSLVPLKQLQVLLFGGRRERE